MRHYTPLPTPSADRHDKVRGRRSSDIVDHPTEVLATVRPVQTDYLARNKSKETTMPPAKKAAAAGATKVTAPGKTAAKVPTAKATAPKATAPQVTITLKQLAAQLAETQDLPKKQAEALLGELVAMATDHLKQGAKLRLTGLGTLQVRSRPARTGRNPATGATIQIAASKKIAFQPAKELKERV
jgi:DNA-binding protein HU-beta